MTNQSRVYVADAEASAVERLLEPSSITDLERELGDAVALFRRLYIEGSERVWPEIERWLAQQAAAYLRVPAGFLGQYRAVLRKPATARVLSDLLGLVGYSAEPQDIERWPLTRRVEAEVYAVNVHVRASDNVCRRHPRPDWLPEPWKGPPRDVSELREDLRGAFEGPEGTPIGALPFSTAFRGTLEDAETLELIAVRDTATGEALEVVAGNPPTVIDARASRVPFTATFIGSVEGESDVQSG